MARFPSTEAEIAILAQQGDGSARQMLAIFLNAVRRTL